MRRSNLRSSGGRAKEVDSLTLCALNSMSEALYDNIGKTYTATRQPDPRIAAAILRALGDADTVVNVGAGAGAYEPIDRSVIAVEVSSRMIRQRKPGTAPAVQAVAEALPFRNQTFDAALAVLTLHHWTDSAARHR